jgi:hypothetical protein
MIDVIIGKSKRQRDLQKVSNIEKKITIINGYR